MIENNKNNRDNLFLAILLIAAGVMRFWHLTWGLPDIYEEATPFRTAWQMWNWGKTGLDLNPHFFSYPSLVIYLNFVIQACHYYAGHLFGVYPNLQSFHQAYTADPTFHILLARMLSALFDFGSVVMVWKLGSFIGGRKVALFAAAIAAVSPLLTQQAHLCNVDTPLTFFTITSLYCLARLSREGDIKWYIGAGICAGMAAASKYTGAVVLLPVAAGHLLGGGSTGQRWMQKLFDRRLLMSMALAAITFLFFNPYIVLSFAQFRQEFGFEEYHMAAGHLGIDPNVSTPAFYLFQMLPQGIGWAGCAAVIIAIIGIVLTRKREHLLLLIFPVVYLAIICSWQMRADRYLLPALPPLILIGALGIVFVLQKTEPLVRSGRLSFALTTMLAVVVLFQPARTAFVYHAGLSLPDTRTIAKDWINAHLPRGAAVIMTPVMLPVPDSNYTVLTIPFFPVAPERVAMFFDTRWYDNVDLLVGSEYDLARYRQNPVRYRSFLRFYDELKTKWNTVFAVEPEGSQSGPAIWLFRPPDSLYRPVFTPELYTELARSPDSPKVVSFLRTLETISRRKQDYAKAEELDRTLVGAERNAYEPRASLALVLYREKKFDEALLQIDQCLRERPEDPDILYLKGTITMQQGSPGDAAIFLQRAIDADPHYALAYEDLYLLYNGQNDYRMAFQILTKYLSVLPPGSEKAQLVQSMMQDIRSR